MRNQPDASSCFMKCAEKGVSREVKVAILFTSCENLRGDFLSLIASPRTSDKAN